MSKFIDFSAPLNADDEQYVRDRPWILQEAAQAGIEIAFESDFYDSDSLEAARAATVAADEDESDEDEDEDEVDYESMTVSELKAEIDARNEERDEDDQIVPDGTKKADLIAALEVDDEATDEDDEDESED